MQHSRNPPIQSTTFMKHLYSTLLASLLFFPITASALDPQPFTLDHLTCQRDAKTVSAPQANQRYQECMATKGYNAPPAPQATAAPEEKALSIADVNQQDSEFIMLLESAH